MAARIAKPIVKDQLWVITDGTKKIGNIVAVNDQFGVRIGDDINYYDSTKNIEELIDIKFEKPPATRRSINPLFATWPTTPKRTYNNFYDVKRKIHVYTKSKSSKCYYCAGYYNLYMGGSGQTVYCPKYIFVQRYRYDGPYFTEAEAAASINKK